MQHILARARASARARVTCWRRTTGMGATEKSPCLQHLIRKRPINGILQALARELPLRMLARFRARIAAASKRSPAG